MNDREDMIRDAHKETFEWIYRDPCEMGKPRDDFTKFLRDASGTYWISGNAGCGKSTLMKYITHHPTTQKLLQEWSGENDLVTAAFHFYYMGADVQKSELSVLVSLLYQILDSKKDLIAVAFPDRFKALIMSRNQQPMAGPTNTELKKGLL